MDLQPRQSVPCAACGSQDPEPLFESLNYRTPGIPTPIAICKTCGHVYVNPRWTPEQYEAVMDLCYQFKFSDDPPDDPDQEKRLGKWRTVWSRIQSYYPQGLRSLLDVGAGQGWCIEYLQSLFPDLQACAIERWPTCCEHMEKFYGARVIRRDLQEPWETEAGSDFHLIVFRHTVEHLMDPELVLAKIAACLAEDGLAYIAAPSLRNAYTGHHGLPFQHDFFRPRHLHYFSREPLQRLCARAGLVPVELREEGFGEIWGVFRRGPAAAEVDSNYEEAKSAIVRLCSDERPLERRFRWRFHLYHALKQSGLLRCTRGLRQALHRLLPTGAAPKT